MTSVGCGMRLPVNDLRRRHDLEAAAAVLRELPRSATATQRRAAPMPRVVRLRVGERVARAEADELFDRRVELGGVDRVGDLREAGGFVGRRRVGGEGRRRVSRSEARASVARIGAFSSAARLRCEDRGSSKGARRARGRLWRAGEVMLVSEAFAGSGEPGLPSP